MKNYVLKKWYPHNDHRKFTYPDDIDEELVPMLDVFNNIPGVRTRYCCCGHGDKGWYIVFSCTSDYMVNVISNYFTDSVSHKDMSEDDLRVIVKCKYEVDCINSDDDIDNYNFIPEQKIAVYCDELGMLPEKERRAEYMRICEFFARCTPMSTWKRVQEW